MHLITYEFRLIDDTLTLRLSSKRGKVWTQAEHILRNYIRGIAKVERVGRRHRDRHFRLSRWPYITWDDIIREIQRLLDYEFAAEEVPILN